MRASSIIHRRGHANPAAEEKKEDCEQQVQQQHGQMSPRADEEKDRRRGVSTASVITRSLVRLGYQISSPSFWVEHRKEFFLAALFLLALVCYRISAASSFFVFGGAAAARHLHYHHHAFHVLEGLKVTFPITGSRDIGMPGPFVSTKEDFYAEDFGELEFDLLGEESSAARPIKYTGNEDLWENFVPTVDSGLEKYYHAYDDDVKRNPYRGWGRDNKGQLERTHHCRMTAQHREITPTCNIIHEINFRQYASDDQGYYLGGGAFRDVFLLEKEKENHDPNVVLKTASYGTKYSASHFEYYRMDSAVATALSPHPLIVDIYSSCSLARKYRDKPWVNPSASFP